MIKIKISVPVKLKKDMARCKHIDWSAVVTEALRKKLEELHESRPNKLKKGEINLVKGLAEASDKNNLYGSEKELFRKLRKK
jgi:hypothetical protein